MKFIYYNKTAFIEAVYYFDLPTIPRTQGGIYNSIVTMNSLWLLTLLILGFLSNIVSLITYTDDALLDEVDFGSLPGAGAIASQISFKSFSGYLNVDGFASRSKRIHYWFFESQRDPVTDPVAFWTNGGPGCSGMLAALTEHGPLKLKKVDNNLELVLNPYSHNQIASIFFVEQPVGVGFSTSQYAVDFNASDASAAHDNYNVIQAFFVKFPHLRPNPFYITSESYGGHYMPTLAMEILNQQTQAQNPFLNFKGFAVGNPYVDYYSGVPAMLDTFWGRSLVAQPAWETYLDSCPQELLADPFLVVDHKVAMKCNDALLPLYEDAIYKTNPYALDWPVCSSGRAFWELELDLKNTKQRHQHQMHTLLMHVAQQHIGGSMVGIKRSLRQTDKGLDHLQDQLTSRKLYTQMEEDGIHYSPCEDFWITSWMNQADVKTSLHVDANIKWMECANSPFRFNDTDTLITMVPYYKQILEHPAAANLSILVYSGTDDSVCSTSGTQRWIWDLGYFPIPGINWLPYTVNGQMGGHITKFQSAATFVFATVLNAGHEVPTYRPRESLALWQAYLDNTWDQLAVTTKVT